MNIKELYEQVRDGRIISDIDLQREIIYSTEKQRLVIDSIVNDIPLPAFYLWENSEGILEVLDGKQRIEAIKRFKENDLEYNGEIWKKTPLDIQEKINNTVLSIIVCRGTEELKREIFNRINTLGIPLSPYEVLNGLFNGEYLRGVSQYVEQDRDARKILGSNSRGKNQMKILRMLQALNQSRQSVNDYVEEHQHMSFEDDQRRLNRYVRFIADVFTDYGQLDIFFYLAVKYIKDIAIWKENKTEINKRVKHFLKSDDAKIIKNKQKEIEDIIQTVVKGISVDPRRLFTPEQKEELVHQYLADPERHKDNKIRCEDCKHFFFEDELTVDHVDPWSKGGRTELSNAQLLCRPCNSKQGNRK